MRKIHNVLDPEKDEEKKVKGMGKGQIVAFSSITLLPLPTVKNNVVLLSLRYGNGTKLVIESQRYLKDCNFSPCGGLF